MLGRKEAWLHAICSFLWFKIDLLEGNGNVGGMCYVSEYPVYNINSVNIQ